MIKGLAYTCANVLGLKDAVDRKKMLEDYRKLGQEDAELQLTQRIDDLPNINLTGDPLCHDDWVVSHIGDGKVILHPYVFNEKSPLIKDDSLQPEKRKTLESNDPVWVFKGVAVTLDESELKRLHPYLRSVHIIV